MANLFASLHLRPSSTQGYLRNMRTFVYCSKTILSSTIAMAAQNDRFTNDDISPRDRGNRSGTIFLSEGRLSDQDTIHERSGTERKCLTAGPS